MPGRRLLVACVLTVLALPAAAQAKTTSYAGSFDETLGSTFSFDLVTKGKGNHKKRIIRNVEFTELPVYCSNGSTNVSNGSATVTAKVTKDDRFQGTNYTESPGGFKTLNYLRGELRSNGGQAAGTFSTTGRGLAAEGFRDCSSAFVEWTVDRV